MAADNEATREKVAAADPMVAALLLERTGLARAGKKERVAQVDVELEKRGCPTAGLPGAASEPVGRSEPPKGRQSRPAAKTATPKKSETTAEASEGD